MSKRGFISFYMFLFVASLIVVGTTQAIEVLPHKERVLIIGDSHMVGPLGKYLDANFRDHELFEVATYGSCGSVARWWYTGQQTPCGFFSKTLEGKTTRVKKKKTPLIENLLDEVQPTSIVVELSGNYKGYSDEFTVADSTRLFNLIVEKDLPCLWIGSPSARKETRRQGEVIELVRSVVEAHCTFVDSRLHTKYPAGGDGYHYWGPAGRREMKKLADVAFETFKNLVIPQ